MIMMNEMMSKTINEADKVERDALMLAIEGKDTIIRGLQREIRQLDEKNALWKATMVKVMNGDVVEYINDNIFPIGDFTEDWEWTAKNRQQMILKIREMLGGGA
jgi:hypothetical protein